MYAEEICMFVRDSKQTLCFITDRRDIFRKACPQPVQSSYALIICRIDHILSAPFLIPPIRQTAYQLFISFRDFHYLL